MGEATLEGTQRKHQFAHVFERHQRQCVAISRVTKVPSSNLTVRPIYLLWNEVKSFANRALQTDDPILLLGSSRDLGHAQIDALLNRRCSLPHRRCYLGSNSKLYDCSYSNSKTDLVLCIPSLIIATSNSLKDVGLCSSFSYSDRLSRLLKKMAQASITPFQAFKNALTQPWDKIKTANTEAERTDIIKEVLPQVTALNLRSILSDWESDTPLPTQTAQGAAGPLRGSTGLSGSKGVVYPSLILLMGYRAD
ncbi:hypothetical protein PROFUN_13660, partial [Planoprotostelium fungivorum]